MTKNQKNQGSGEPLASVLRDAKEVSAVEQYWHLAYRSAPRRPPKDYNYIEELAYLQFELIKLQEWVRLNGLRVVIIFEGRDAAGKGGAIKRIVQSLNPRICHVVALGTPTERQRGEWYFQRYVAELPARGEIVLFDRSWYNRAGVERVMDSAPTRSTASFCDPARCSRKCSSGPVSTSSSIGSRSTMKSKSGASRSASAIRSSVGN